MAGLDVDNLYVATAKAIHLTACKAVHKVLDAGPDIRNDIIRDEIL